MINKEYLGIRLKPITKKELEKIAEEKETTTSELIRKVLEEYTNT